MIKKILTIGESSPLMTKSIQTDLKVFQDYSHFGFTTITSLSLQDGQQHHVETDVFEAQIETVLAGGHLDGILINSIASKNHLQTLINLIEEQKNVFSVLDLQNNDNIINLTEPVKKKLRQLIELVDIIICDWDILNPLYFNVESPTQRDLKMRMQDFNHTGVKQLLIKNISLKDFTPNMGLLKTDNLLIIYDQQDNISFSKPTFGASLISNCLLDQTISSAISNSLQYVDQLN